MNSANKIILLLLCLVLFLIIGIFSVIKICYNNNAEEYLNQKIKVGSDLYKIKIYRIPVEKNARLLEVYEKNNKNVLVVYSKHKILQSSNDGKTWTTLYKDIDFEKDFTPAKSFTMSNGNRLIFLQHKNQKRDNNLLYEFDKDGKLIAKTSINAYSWHGSIGIGEDESGNVLFAEYRIKAAENAKRDEVIAIYKRIALGKYKKVLLKTASESRGEIRHFHLCYPNPINPKQWIAATGDGIGQSRFFVSNNGGETWIEYKVDKPIDDRMDYEHRNQIFRFTSFSYTDDGKIIWGTDDGLGLEHPAIITADLNKKIPEFKFNTLLPERNFARNILKINGNLFLIITEAKSDFEKAQIYLYDYNTNEYGYINIKNVINRRNAVTGSIGSKIAMKNNTGYFKIKNALDKNIEIVKIKIEKQKNWNNLIQYRHN